MLDLFGLVGCLLVLVFGIYSIFKSDSIDEKHKEYYECTKAYFDNAWKKSEPVTGLRKIDTLIDTLNNLQIADDRPALWRLCESLINSLTEIKKEHEAEVEELKASANRLAMVDFQNEKTIKEIMYERDARSTAIDTLRKQLKEA